MQMFRSRGDRDVELLSAYLDGALSPRARRQIDSRLQREPALRGLLDELSLTRDMLRGLPEVPVPRNFTLTAKQAEAIRPARGGGGLPWLQLATAVVTMLLAVVLVGDFAGFGLGDSRQMESEAALAPVEGGAAPEMLLEEGDEAEFAADGVDVQAEAEAEAELAEEAAVELAQGDAADGGEAAPVAAEVEEGVEIMDAPPEEPAPAEVAGDLEDGGAEDADMGVPVVEDEAANGEAPEMLAGEDGGDARVDGDGEDDGIGPMGTAAPGPVESPPVVPTVMPEETQPPQQQPGRYLWRAVELGLGLLLLTLLGLNVRRWRRRL